jgi:hypothetical protein
MGERNEQDATEGQVFRPGQTVPTSGIYECDGQDCDHQWSTNVKGHAFPPMQEGCHGQGWKLRSETPHRQ